MSKVAIIAAMERELAPLVRGWKRATLSSGEERSLSLRAMACSR